MQQSHQWYHSTTGTTETTTSNELQSCHSRPFPWPWSCQPWEGGTVPSTCKISIHLTHQGFLINFCQCETCRKVTYLTQPISKIVLNSHKNFPLLKLCKDELATTPHVSQPVPDANGSNSSQITLPSVSASHVIAALNSDPTLASLRHQPVPKSGQQLLGPAASLSSEHNTNVSRESIERSSSSSTSLFSQATAAPSPTTSPAQLASTSSATASTTCLLMSGTGTDRSIPVTLWMYAKVYSVFAPHYVNIN